MSVTACTFSTAASYSLELDGTLLWPGLGWLLVWDLCSGFRRELGVSKDTLDRHNVLLDFRRTSHQPVLQFVNLTPTIE